jgi:RHS repeat-associated protein
MKTTMMFAMIFSLLFGPTASAVKKPKMPMAHKAKMTSLSKGKDKKGLVDLYEYFFDTKVGQTSEADGAGYNVDAGPDLVSYTLGNPIITGSGFFTIVNDNCSNHDILGVNCRFGVKFAPTSTGTFSMSVTWTSTVVVVDPIFGQTTFAGTMGVWTFKANATGIVIPQKDCDVCGSIIHSSNQSLVEKIPLVGIDFNLNYYSARSANYISPDISFGSYTYFNSEGWTPSIHHFYDIASGVLWRGDGKAENANFVVNGGSRTVVSSDGSEMYLFDNTSHHHTQTISTLTGAVKYNFAYDVGGYLTGITDAYGNVTTFTRDGSEKLVSIQGPYGQLTAVTVDANGLLTSVQNPKGETYSLTYKTGTSLLETFTKPAAQVTTWTYDTNGLLTKELSNGGNSWNLSSAVSGGTTTISVSSTLGRTTTVQKTAGNAFVEHYPDGNTNTHSENGLNFNQTDINSIDSSSTTHVLDERLGPNGFNRLSQSTYGIASPATTVTTSFGQTIAYPSGVTPDYFNYSTITKTSTVGGATTTSVFDNSTKTATTTSPLGATSAVTLNTNEKPSQIQIGSDTPVTLSYDTHGRLTSAIQGTHNGQTLTYNTAGFIDTITNSRSETTGFTYDLSGRPTSITLPDSRVVGYTYDANGNTTSITPPGLTAHSFAFNAYELLGTYTPPSLTSGSVATTYAYNSDKQLTLVTRPDGRTITYTYNSGPGQLTTIATDDGNYSYTYGTIGRMTSETSSHSFVNAYSWAGRLIATDTQQSTTGSFISKMSYTYDSLLRLATRTIQGTTSVSRTFSYNSDQKPSQVGDMTLAYEYPSGRLSTTTIGGISDSRTYDTYGQLSGYAATFTPSGGSPSTLYSYTLTRDLAGRISSKSETVEGQTNVYDYTYDTAGRLTQVKRNGNIESSYAYDSNSNRTSGTVDGSSFTSTFDSQDRLLTFNTNGYTYTQNGEVSHISKPPMNDRIYTYGVLGNLHLFTSPTGDAFDYSQDAKLRRVARRKNGTVEWRYMYTANRVVAQLDGTSLIKKEFVHGTSDLAADYMIDGSNKYRLIKDQLGSVRLVVNVTDGTIAERLDYDEWGKVLRDTNTCFQPWGFAGGIYDKDTGFLLFGARDYDPETGRWVSKDPIRFKGGDTNLYGYVLNDPVNFIDPEGKSWFGIGATLVCGIYDVYSFYQSSQDIARHQNQLRDLRQKIADLDPVEDCDKISDMEKQAVDLTRTITRLQGESYAKALATTTICAGFGKL